VAIQRRRIDEGEGDATVVVGASRMLFDVQLACGSGSPGRRPIQLALEGTSPMTRSRDWRTTRSSPAPCWSGSRRTCFFSEFEYRGSVFKAARDENAGATRRAVAVDAPDRAYVA
jgi:hypothetical protein